MSTDETISKLIDQAKRGDDVAAAALWDVYFPRLRRYAAARLRNNYEDAEDVALSAIKSFLMAAQNGRFPDLDERNDLWRLLSTLTRRKAVDLIRQRLSQKAGGGKLLSESAILADIGSRVGLNGVADPRPTQDLEVMFVEQVEHLLDILDADKQHVAIAKMEGYTNQEIAQQLNVSHWTVERMLRHIRDHWEREIPS
jgi:RNA polymerase sigma factor (sigma-70 family)